MNFGTMNTGVVELRDDSKWLGRPRPLAANLTAQMPLAESLFILERRPEEMFCEATLYQ